MKFSINEEAVFNHRLDGCNSYTLDLSIGCDHNCVYCHFSLYQKTLYKRVNRDYRGQTIPLKIQRILSTPKEELPNRVYFSFSTDPFATKVKELSHQVLEHLLKNGVEVLIVTKGIIPDETIALLSQYGEQVSVELGLTNLDPKRNLFIEPGTPSVEKRLELLHKLGHSPIAYTSLKMDPLFPEIDDNEKSVSELFAQVAPTKVQNVSVSYVIASDRMIERMKKVKYLQNSLKFLTEKSNDTVATKAVYSVALDYKLEKFAMFRKMGEEYSYEIHTCHCKDARLKKLDPNYTCHPGDNPKFIKSKFAIR